VREVKKPAVFLDRDGVLNRYLPGDYVKSVEELEVLPGVGEAIARLNAAGFVVYLISNQQGVAKGIMSEADLHAVDAALHAEIAAAGGRIEKSYYCTHSSQAQCDCRKPQPGLIRTAAEENNLDLAHSYFIGDTETDALAAHAAGVGAFFLVLTGKHLVASVGADKALFPNAPDYIARDMPSAAEVIVTLETALKSRR